VAREPEPEPVPVPAALAKGPRAPAQLAWGVLFALAVLLAVATVAIAVVGILGGSI
jgi:hypothetical protein